MYWLRRLFRLEQTERQLDSELRFHLEQRTAELIDAGQSPDDARRQAQIEFGGVEVAKEQCRESRRVHFVETLLQDVRYALRTMRRSPGFTVVAVLTLTLGLGASTAVFSITNAVLLRPLPYPNAEELVLPWKLSPPGLSIGYSMFPWDGGECQFFIHQAKAFRYLGVFKGDSFNLTHRGEPALLQGTRASAGFFPALGISPFLGRTFTSEEDSPGHEYVVVLGYRLWQEHFGADPAVLGQTVDLNGYAYTVIGVMPSGFSFPRGEELPAIFNFPKEAQLWVPLALPPEPRGASEFAPIARMQPGATMAQAQSEMDVLGKRLADQHPQYREWYTYRVVPLARQVTGDTRLPLLLVLGAVGIVLLIACSNVANLLLARSLGRGREFTVRAALGAPPGRLIRQLLTESLLLAATSAITGILVAWAGTFLVKRFGPSNIPRLHEVTLDLRVFAFTLGVTVLAGILFGMAPALGAARHNLVDSLKQGGHKMAGNSSAPRVRHALLVSQVALALVLLAAAGLLVRTFYRMISVDPGFNADHVLTFELPLPVAKFSDTGVMAQHYTEVLQRLRTVPGVEFTGFVSTVPMGGTPDGTVIRIPGRPAIDDKEQPFASYSFASPGYFKAVGTPLLQGRDFAETDTLSSASVTVINNSMARKFWPNQDPIGKQVGVNIRYPLRTIIGVVADVKRTSLREVPDPEMFVPYTQNEIKVWPSMQSMQFALRVKGDPDSLLDSVRAAVHSVDPDLPVAKAAALQVLVNNSMVQPRFSAVLLGSFAILALLLASVGMYGVISYSVAQRTPEIGVRMALGAQRRDIFALVFGWGSRFVISGMVIGLAMALGTTRLMARFLFGVRPTDPVTFAGVALLFILVACMASYLPARKAIAVDPKTALSSE